MYTVSSQRRNDVAGEHPETPAPGEFKLKYLFQPGRIGKFKTKNLVKYGAIAGIIAYLRQLDGETVLVVNNLSRTAQAVQLDLREFKGAIPIEMFGGNPFPRIGDLPYLLTLGPYHFFWFSLRRL